MAQTLQLGNVQVDVSRLADLCTRYRVCKLFLFGSAARGEMRPDRDVDMLMEFSPNSGIISRLRRIDVGFVRTWAAQSGSCFPRCADHIAAGKASVAIKSTYAQVPWANLVAFRNILVPAYLGLD